MCVIAAKYFASTGWVGVKNRDRNYKPVIKIRKSFRQDVERLYIWDEITKYTEGINEYGIGILSASVAVKSDEKEIDKVRKNKKKTNIYSPDGKKIRKALLEKNINKAIKKLIELKLIGNTIIFNKEECFVIESANNQNKYEYKIKSIPQDKTVVRTNHGILLKYTGYAPDRVDKFGNNSRQSSVNRLKIVREEIEKIKNPYDMLDCISNTDNKDPQLNPLRMDDRHIKSIRTTGQIMIVSGDNSLHYRPIYCKTIFDYDKINSPVSKTFFEIISNRKLLSLNIKEMSEKIVLNWFAK